jgi:hypothetical protein
VAVLARLPAVAGVAEKVIVKLPPMPIVTVAPLAVQVNIPPAMPQLTLPGLVMLVKLPAVGVP